MENPELIQVVTAVAKLKEMSIDGKVVTLHSDHDLCGMPFFRVEEILHLLEAKRCIDGFYFSMQKRDEALRTVQFDDPDRRGYSSKSDFYGGVYSFSVLPAFDAYAHDVLKSAATLKVASEVIIQANQKADDEVVLELEQRGSGIILNNFFLIAKPHLNGINDLIFTHLMQNPGIEFTWNEIVEATRAETDSKKKDFHDFLKELNFTKELKQVFFRAGRDTITFRPKVTRRELVEILGKDSIKVRIQAE